MTDNDKPRRRPSKSSGQPPAEVAPSHAAATSEPVAASDETPEPAFAFEPAFEPAATSEPTAFTEFEPEPAALEPSPEPEPEPAAAAADLGKRFASSLYMAMNPDVAVAVARGDIGASDHWRIVGNREQRAGQRPSLSHLVHLAAPRVGRRSEADASDDAMAQFEASGYGFLNVDLRPLIGQDPDAAQQHWLELGLFEGRRAPGWRPNAGRHASVAGLLARPRGVDLYAPFGHFGPLGRLARRLALALADSDISHTLYAFDLQGGRPRVPLIDRDRPGRHRVSLVLCEPAILQALVDNYPSDHFADSYVIGLWGADWRTLLLQGTPAESAIDEVWVADTRDAARLAPCLGAPVRTLPWPVDPAADAVERTEMRAALGIAPQTRAILFSLYDMLPSWSDAPTVDLARVQLHAVLDAFLRLPAERDAVLLVQAPRDPVSPAIADLLNAVPDARIKVMAAPTVLGQDAGLQAAADVLIRGDDGLAGDLRGAAFLAAGLPVVVPAPLGIAAEAQAGVCSVATDAFAFAFADPARRHLSLPVYQSAALADALENVLVASGDSLSEGVSDAMVLEAERRFVAALQDRVVELGLDAQPLGFISHFGTSSDLGQPVIFAGLSERSRDQVEKLAQRPFFDVLLIVPPHGPGADPQAIERSLAALARQTYALRRIHLVAATDGSGPDLHALPTARSGVGAAVLAPRPGLSLADAFTDALAACTGSHLVFVEAGALPMGWALTELAIGADTKTKTSLFAESEIVFGTERQQTRRARSGHRLTSQLDVGPMLCVPHAVVDALLPLSAAVVEDPCFALAAALIARSFPVDPLDLALTAVPAELVQDAGAARTKLLAEIGSAEASRLLTNPRTGITRLAPPLERLPSVTLVAVAVDAVTAGAVLAMLRRFRQTSYQKLGFTLIADASLEGRLDVSALRDLGVAVQYADAQGEAATLRQRGLITATTQLVVFVDPELGLVDDSWLAELAEPALGPGFGAAGVAIACGGATPLHLQEVAAVDGACLLVDRIAALDVGGFEASYGRAADVALCLALRSVGARVVVVPDAGVTLPVRDGLALLEDLRADWGSFVPDDFGKPIRPIRPIRTHPARPGQAAGTALRIRPLRDPARPVPAAAPERDSRLATSQPPSGGWRRSV